MKNIAEESYSIREKISKRASISVFVLVLVITAIMLLSVYIISNRLYAQQINSWLDVVPRYVLPHLRDSDYFSIESEVRFLKSTGLFSNFAITDAQKKIVASFSNNSTINTQTYTPIQDNANSIWGYYTFQPDFSGFFSPFIILIILFLLCMASLYLLIRWRLQFNINQEFKNFNQFIYEIEKISHKISYISEQNFNASLSNKPCSQEQSKINKIITQLVTEIRNSHHQLRQVTIESEKQKSKEALAKAALQVAHDIRSPLAALEMITEVANQFPEEQRIIIRSAVGRIRDIANSLLDQHREKTNNVLVNNTSLKTEDKEKSVYLLSSLLNLILSEKRLQFRPNSNVEIESHLGASAYGLFVSVNLAEFKRILSNLINNAVEAISGKGKVDIEVYVEKKYINITIRDNGKGIPPDILNQLGKQKTTFGKTQGNGLGVYHAVKTVAAWSGELNIYSTLNVGTKVSILLPKISAPSWFVPFLSIDNISAIVVLDDDISIHHIWDERFKHFSKLQGYIFHFSTPNQLRQWLDEYSGLKEKTIFLCDYELVGFEENGLDIIEQCNINQQSILVTSRFEEKNIRNHCKKLNIKLIPKGDAPFVPIQLMENHETILPSGNYTENKLDAILIDDDPIVHKTWSFSAVLANKNLKCFSSAKDFFAELNLFERNTPIYIDSKLQSDMRGEEVSKIIYDQGFLNIYIQTGYCPENFKAKNWIKGVLGKNPPW